MTAEVVASGKVTTHFISTLTYMDWSTNQKRVIERLGTWGNWHFQYGLQIKETFYDV